MSEKQDRKMTAKAFHHKIPRLNYNNSLMKNQELNTSNQLNYLKILTLHKLPKILKNQLLLDNPYNFNQSHRTQPAFLISKLFNVNDKTKCKMEIEQNIFKNQFFQQTGIIVIAKGYNTINKSIKKKLNQQISQTKIISIRKNKQFLLASQRNVYNQSPIHFSPETDLDQKNRNEKIYRDQKKIFINNKPNDSNYKYFIGLGNGNDVLVQALKKREKWQQTSQGKKILLANSLFNFRWTPNSQRQKFLHLDGKSGLKQIINHFQFHQQLTNKVNLIKNLKHLCQFRRINVFNITPLSFLINLNQESVQNQVVTFLKFFIQKNPNGSKPNFQSLKKLFRFNLCSIKKNQSFKQIEKNFENESTMFSNENFIWMLKPSDQNRGRGVYLFNNLDDFSKLLKKYEQKQQSSIKLQKKNQIYNLRKSYIKSQTFIVQKYIQKPLLINQKKFDIRVWVLLDWKMDIYFYKQGYLRVASQNFKLNNIIDPFIHLTNTSIQKHSENYCFQTGNHLPLTFLDKYFIQNQQIHSQNLVQKMKGIVLLTMESVKKKINRNSRKYCFQLYGYDFMIDQDFKLWLIQINTNPSLQISSKLMQLLMPNLIEDTLKLTIDNIFSKKHQLNENHRNRYEIIGSIREVKKIRQK